MSESVRYVLCYETRQGAHVMEYYATQKAAEPKMRRLRCKATLKRADNGETAGQVYFDDSIGLKGRWNWWYEGDGQVSILVQVRARSLKTPAEFNNGSQDPKRYYPPHTVPCVVCMKPIRRDSKAPLVRLHDGGAYIVTEKDAELLNDAGWEGSDCGGWPIGRDCISRFPAVRKYLIR